jgi:hypothetical protein
VRKQEKFDMVTKFGQPTQNLPCLAHKQAKTKAKQQALIAVTV